MVISVYIEPRGSAVIPCSENMKLLLTFTQINEAAIIVKIPSLRPAFIFQRELNHTSKSYGDIQGRFKFPKAALISLSDHVLSGITMANGWMLSPN